MKKESMVVRGALIVGFATALLLSFGCGGSDTGSGATPPALACSDAGAAAANTVIMSCAGAIDGTTEKVNVVIGGPASGTTTLRGLNFEVTYDPAKVVFVSATNGEGGIFPPSALVAPKAFPDDPIPHVVLAIQLVMGVPDVVVGAGQHVVMTLTFQGAPGATFAGTPLNFDLEKSEATSPSNPVTFASGLVLSYR